MMNIPRLEEVVRRDPRYPYEAYEFLFAALAHTQSLLGRLPEELDPEKSGDETHHVTPRELLDGIRDLAHKEFGLMARTVFREWNVNSTADWGEMVFNLIEFNLMSKTPDDRREDFVGVYDLDKALVEDYRIVLDETE